MVAAKTKPPEPTAEPEHDPWAGLDRILEPFAVAIASAIKAKGASYTDAKHRSDEIKADRAVLMSRLHLAFSERVEPTQEHPVEGLFLGEEDLSLRYREKIRVNGLFLLPTVVEVLPADNSGNVTAIVEFAIADIEGRLWPAAVRVAGTGNDRIARGVVGAQALSRALSAAWKEAVCRIAFLARPNDPEAHEVKPDAPAAQSRPSNQRQQQKPGLSLKEEDDWRTKALAWLGTAEGAELIETWLADQRVKDKLALVSQRTRKAIEGEAAECIRRLRSDTRRQEDDDQGQIESHMVTNRSERGDERRQDDSREQAPYIDPDDDIPF